jgi:hypothetical protein
MIIRACAQPSPRKAFTKKVCTTRRTELKSVRESLKKIATEEVSRIQTLFKEHVAFFQEPDPEPIAVRVESFIDPNVPENFSR